MSMDENPKRVPEEPATNDAGALQSTGVSVTEANLDDRTENLDDVAGSEFVDDRIREED